MKTAIYYLKYNHSNNIAYVGKTVDPKKRKSKHKKNHPFCYMDIQYWCDSDGSAEEIAEIAKHKPPLNQTMGGEGGRLGLNHTKETKIKIAEASKKRWENPEYKRRLSRYFGDLY